MEDPDAHYQLEEFVQGNPAWFGGPTSPPQPFVPPVHEEGFVDDVILETWINLLTDLRNNATTRGFQQDQAVKKIVSYSQGIAIQLGLRRQKNPPPNNVFFLEGLFEKSRKATLQAFRENTFEFLTIAAVCPSEIQTLMDPDNEMVDTHLATEGGQILDAAVTAHMRRFRHILTLERALDERARIAGGGGGMGSDVPNRDDYDGVRLMVDEDVDDSTRALITGGGGRVLTQAPAAATAKRRARCVCLVVVVVCIFCLITVALIAAFQRQRY
jgi:hypothetical protein